MVADNRYIAEDAPTLIDDDFESLAAVVDQFAALKPGCPMMGPWTIALAPRSERLLPRNIERLVGRA